VIARHRRSDVHNLTTAAPNLRATARHSRRMCAGGMVNLGTPRQGVALVWRREAIEIDDTYIVKIELHSILRGAAGLNQTSSVSPGGWHTRFPSAPPPVRIFCRYRRALPYGSCGEHDARQAGGPLQHSPVAAIGAIPTLHKKNLNFERKSRCMIGKLGDVGKMGLQLMARDAVAPRSR
jgi:hypothetical protein